jgi:pimeloyl-ACP methyl ester carboxylesterase
LAVVLRSEASRARALSIELYGHSGGGTLAILLAAQVTNVRRVVTIGPTLDIDAWCLLHGYSPLLGSLNAIDSRFPLERVRVLHLVGSEDTNTPPYLVEAAAARAGMTGSVRIIPGFTHNCCWQELWNEVLQESL